MSIVLGARGHRRHVPRAATRTHALGEVPENTTVLTGDRASLTITVTFVKPARPGTREDAMTSPVRCLRSVSCVALVLLAASAASAQIEDQLSTYTGDNAEGYLSPLATAIGAGLNSGVWKSAYIPPDGGFHIHLETHVAGLFFDDELRTFSAVTEEGFSPETTTNDAPTVVGSGEALIISGDGGSSFAFPGGFDVNSFVLAAPQVRVGAFRGTEVMFRGIGSVDLEGDTELSTVSFWGIGVHHSISQYLGPVFPVDLAAGVFYQKIALGEDLIDASAFQVSAQVGKRLPVGFAVIEPYAGLSVDTFSMDVVYEKDDVDIDLSFDTETTLDLTVGLNLTSAFFTLNGEYSIASQNSFVFGFGLGF